MRNLWLVVIPTFVLLVITETVGRNSLSINEREHNALTLSDVKGKKIKHKDRAATGDRSLSEDLQGKRILIKVNEENEGNEDDGGRLKRDITELDEVKNAKKSYAKLKLAQTQSDLKKWKNKDYGKYLDERTTKKIDKRQANYRNNRKSANRSKRYVKPRYQVDDTTDYYAQRTAIMERYYARQREIEEKPAQQMSTVPKYIYTHNLDTKTNTNNVSSTSKVEENSRESNNVFNDFDTNSNLGISTSVTTFPKSITGTTTKIGHNSFLTQVQPVQNLSEIPNEKDVLDDYRYYVNDDVRDNSDSMTNDNISGTLKWGNNCTGRMVYQNNLILTTRGSSSTVANLTTSFSGPLCITCIRAIPMNNTKCNMSLDVGKNENDEVNVLKVSMIGVHADELWYVTKVWATTKKKDVCEEVQN